MSQCARKPIPVHRSGSPTAIVAGALPSRTSVASRSPVGKAVDVASVGLSSAPNIGLAYLGSAGQVLGVVSLVSVPTATNGFTTLTQSLTVPANVTQLRIVLTGFAATDLRTSGTVTFDNVRLE